MPSKLHRKWSELLRKALADADMSQHEFATRLGVTDATASRWLRGEDGAPSDERRAEVARLLKKDPIDLFPFEIKEGE